MIPFSGTVLFVWIRMDRRPDETTSNGRAEKLHFSYIILHET